MTDPVVEINCGRLRGVAEKTAEGFKYCAFKGIPYAEPPIGQLRFKDPVPIGKWSGTRDATEYGLICAQYDYISQERSTNEDCLHLNVYVNSVSDPNARKAVMVWIHGGGFYFGSGNDTFYGPDYLVTKDIVLVTVNYRLGVFGFLNLENEQASGNQGFKDQVMALRWVQDNIKAFGGDPNNVTIFGESAGGAAVHYLSISPLAKGLFHKAISQSGVVFNPWAVNYNGKKSVFELCSILGNPLQDPKAILEFLQTVDCEKIIGAQNELRAKLKSLPFGPEVDSSSPNPFMPVPAEELAEQGVHVPYLVGYNGREGIFFLLDITKEQLMDVVDQNFESVLGLGSHKLLKRHNLTPQQFRRLYYKSERISANNIDKYVDISSDLHFIEGIHRFVKIQTKQSSAPTYLYQLTYDPGYSAIKSQVSTPLSGTSHFDDIGYLFKMNMYDKVGLSHLRKGTQDYKIMDQMTELWTNFAKYGKPTIETSELIPTHWQPVADGTVLRYLNIDEDLTMQTTLNVEQKYLSAKSIKP